MRTRVLCVVVMLVAPTPAIAEEAATDPAVQEEQALDADIDAANKKVEAAAEEATPGFDEIKAPPLESADENDTIGTKAETKLEAKLSGTEGLDSDHAFGGLISVNHQVGTGTFMSDSTMRSRFRYVGQSWDIRPHYIIDVHGIKLKAALRLSFEDDFTAPDTTPSRRFIPFDTTLGVSAPELYKDPLTEVSFNAGVRLLLPTSYESIETNKQWSGVSLTAGAQRFFGPLHVSYSLGFTKYVNGQTIPDRKTSVPRPGEVGTIAGGLDQPAAIPAGFAPASFAIANSFGIDYSITETLSVSYGLLIRNFFSYTHDNVNVIDQYTSPNAHDDRGRRDQLWPSLEVDYVVDEWVKKVADLPVSLTVSLGISSVSPAQTANNKDIYWPFFYQTFAQDHAADNYGSFFFDITGVL